MKLVNSSKIIDLDERKHSPYLMACRKDQTAVVDKFMSEDNIIDIKQTDQGLYSVFVRKVGKLQSICHASDWCPSLEPNLESLII